MEDIQTPPSGQWVGRQHQIPQCQPLVESTQNRPLEIPILEICLGGRSCELPGHPSPNLADQAQMRLLSATPSLRTGHHNYDFLEVNLVKGGFQILTLIPLQQASQHTP